MDYDSIFHRIKTIKKRNHSGNYNNLKDNQKYLYNIIKKLSKGNSELLLKNGRIEKECDPEFDFRNRDNVITDFCYNKINKEDNENKFLMSPKNGHFRFVDFNWNSDETIDIKWRINDLGQSFSVGTYKKEIFHWDFNLLENHLIQLKEKNLDQAQSRRSRIIELLDDGLPDNEIIRIIDNEFLNYKFRTISTQALSGVKWDLKKGQSDTLNRSLWTDTELKAVVEAYFLMLSKELRGESYSKAEINRQLRKNDLQNRSKGSVEFRMQNISSVLHELCHPFIKGYLPRGNVGIEVAERIKKVIFSNNFLTEKNYTPTYDLVELDKKVSSLVKQKLSGKPKGKVQPKRRPSSNSSFERDPLVKAWVLQNANGICEKCGIEGPFIDKIGNPYLESHHVVFLSNDGEDTIENSVAVCPNCHKECHFSEDIVKVQYHLMKTVKRINTSSNYSSDLKR